MVRLRKKVFNEVFLCDQSCQWGDGVSSVRDWLCIHHQEFMWLLFCLHAIVEEASGIWLHPDNLKVWDSSVSCSSLDTYFKEIIFAYTEYHLQAWLWMTLYKTKNLKACGEKQMSVVKYLLGSAKREVNHIHSQIQMWSTDIENM
jgi:hypothetical protein